MKKKISYIVSRIGGIVLNSLEGRINFQKSIYLLKEMGAIKESFSFTWYIFGPYSSRVATIGFDFVERKIDKELDVSDDFESKLDVFEKIKQMGKDESKWLELLASMHYLLKNNKLEKEKLFEKIKEHKSYFEDRNLLEKGFENIKSNFIF